MATLKLIFTVGHSTRTGKEFTELLKTYDINLLVDIRHYPGSRYCPQFGKATLSKNLARHDIDYIHLESLGGRRKSAKESELNAGWRSPQFRGYADYMQTKDFALGLKQLMSLARKNHVAIMCSEAVPWRCHRSLVADALLLNDFIVFDLISMTSVKPHELTSFAFIDEGKVTYPGS